MQVKITKNEHTGKIRQNRKENKFVQEIAALVADQENQSRAVVTLRIYSTPSAAYACLWANGSSVHISGGGRATGYGYHRASAAAENAFRDAGIELSESIGGVGDSAMERAVIALAKKLTRKKFFIHKSHA